MLYRPVFTSKLPRLPLEAPSPSPTAEASSPSPPEAPSLSGTAKASSSSPPKASYPSHNLTAKAVGLSLSDVTSPSETSPRPFGATSPHLPFRPSAVVLKDAIRCPFISIEGSTISDSPPMGALYRFLASPLMPPSYQHRLFVDIGSTSMAASPSISDSR